MVDWTQLPGIAEGRRWRNIGVGVLYVFVILLVIGAVAPEDDDANGATPEMTPTPEPTATDGGTVTAPPVSTPGLTATPGELSDDELETLMRTVMAEQGVDVVLLSSSDGSAYLAYQSTASTESELVGEMGTVSGAYAGAVEQGYTPTTLTAEIENTDGELAARYRIERGWAEQYNSGAWSSEELSERILQTFESF